MKPRSYIRSFVVPLFGRSPFGCLSLLAIATCDLGGISPAMAQETPSLCLETAERKQIYATGERAGRVQVDQLWRTVGEDCTRMPQLSMVLLRHLSRIQGALGEETLSPTIACRFHGQFNAVLEGWEQLVQTCSASR